MDHAFAGHNPRQEAATIRTVFGFKSTFQDIDRSLHEWSVELLFPKALTKRFINHLRVVDLARIIAGRNQNWDNTADELRAGDPADRPARPKALI